MLFSIRLAAQGADVTIYVVNNKKEPVPFASIMVFAEGDIAKVEQKVSDSSGTAYFQLLQGLSYHLRISSVNFEPLQKGIIINGPNPTFTLELNPLARALAGVTVTSTRPLMRQEEDKTIVDPEPLANSSTNAFEMMEKVPGLFVDQDGNIYLNSTTPAIVYINGREQKMSTADIATMLKSLPPNSIASIEILRTPSAKYDASGSGGIVNVVLKKGVRIGLTGSVNLGLNQGRFGNRFAGLNLSNISGALSTYVNLQYSRRNTYERINTNRIFAPDSMLSQDAFTRYPTNSIYLGYGAGYQFNKKWDLIYDGRLSVNQAQNTSTNKSMISAISTGILDEHTEATVQNKAASFNISQGLATKYKLDTLGSEWATDVSFTFSPNNSGQVFQSAFHLPVRPAIGGDGNIDNRLQFVSAQTNLHQKLNKHLTVEMGIKTTFVQFRNATDYFSLQNGTRAKDPFRTRSYRYRENINSAYLQASRDFSGIVVKVGARLENTHMKGRQTLPGDTIFALRRTDLFPYVYISRNIMKIMGYELKAYLIYRRTISRPAYEYLNPFPRYVDQYLFETGNPSLRPQFTKNYEANVSVDERPVLAIGYNDTRDIFTNVIYIADSSKVAYRTYDNLGGNKESYFRALGAIPPGKKYFIVGGIQYNRNFYQGLYEGRPLSFKRGSWSIFSYQSLKITPLTQLTLSGFARFNGQLQFYELSSFGAVNMSLSQQLLKRKLSVTLSATDLFFTNNNEFTLQQGNVNATGFREADTRRYGLNIRYNFGMRKKEENSLINLESPEKAN